jgi:sulfur carrier protein ThiS
VKLKVKTVAFDIPDSGCEMEDGRYVLEVEPPFTAQDLIDRFGFSDDTTMVVNVNGNAVDNDRELQETDYIMMMRAMYGG